MEKIIDVYQMRDGTHTVVALWPDGSVKQMWTYLTEQEVHSKVKELVHNDAEQEAARITRQHPPDATG